MATLSSIVGISPMRFLAGAAAACMITVPATWAWHVGLLPAGVMKAVAIFGMAIGLALFVVVTLYVDALRLYSLEQRVMAAYLANREAEEKARAKRRQRPVVPLRASIAPAKPVTPPGWTLTQDGNLIRKAA